MVLDLVNRVGGVVLSSHVKPISPGSGQRSTVSGRPSSSHSSTASRARYAPSTQTRKPTSARNGGTQRYRAQAAPATTNMRTPLAPRATIGSCRGSLRATQAAQISVSAPGTRHRATATAPWRADRSPAKWRAGTAASAHRAAAARTRVSTREVGFLVWVLGAYL